MEVFLQKKRDAVAAKRFFKRQIRLHGNQPRKIVTNKLQSYMVTHRELMPDVMHDTSKYANNRVELSHEPTQSRVHVMRKFKSFRHAQHFLYVHAAVYNVSNIGRHVVRAGHHRKLREGTFGLWATAVA